MRRPALSALLVLASAIAAPAGAQIVGPRPPSDYRPPNPFIGDSSLPGPTVGRDVRDLRQRVDRARESGAISRREARRLDREARLIRRLAARYGRDGMSASEKAELEARSRYLRDAVNRPRAGGSGKR